MQGIPIWWYLSFSVRRCRSTNMVVLILFHAQMCECSCRGSDGKSKGLFRRQTEFPQAGNGGHCDLPSLTCMYVRTDIHTHLLQATQISQSRISTRLTGAHGCPQLHHQSCIINARLFSGFEKGMPLGSALLLSQLVSSHSLEICLAFVPALPLSCTQAAEEKCQESPMIRNELLPCRQLLKKKEGEMVPVAPLQALI